MQARRMCSIRLFLRPLRQLQDERLQSTQIKFQSRIVFGFRAARLLKFGIRFCPALLSKQNYPAPERVTLRKAFWSGFSCKPKRFVNFKPVMRVQSAHKINWARDNCFAHSIKSRRFHQSLGSVEAIQGAKSACQVDGFAARQEQRAPAFLQRTGNDRAGADSYANVPAGSDLLL